jgi:hypothetical protein
MRKTTNKITNNSISVDSVSESPDSPRFANKDELVNRLKSQSDAKLNNDNKATQMDKSQIKHPTECLPGNVSLTQIEQGNNR